MGIEKELKKTREAVMSRSSMTYGKRLERSSIHAINRALVVSERERILRLHVTSIQELNSQDLVRVFLPYCQTICTTAMKYSPNKIRAAVSDLRAGNTQFDQLNMVCPSMAAKMLPFVLA
jgi:hypothetical protein